VSGSGADVPSELDPAQTSVLVFDAEHPGGVAAAARHRDAVRLVGVVSDSASERVMDVLAAGGAGVLVRGELTPLALVACLRAVTHGQSAVPTDLMARMLRGRDGAGGGELAGRELHVLRLLADGSTTRAIAGELCYSERTVKNIVRDVLLKLDSSTRAQAVATATRQGLI
jgi:DNA-binding NarL/FixJ family response regulator